MIHPDVLLPQSYLDVRKIHAVRDRLNHSRVNHRAEGVTDAQLEFLSRTDNRVIAHMSRNHSTWAAMCRLRLASEYPYRYITGIVTYLHELGGDSEDDYSHGTSGLIRRLLEKHYKSKRGRLVTSTE